MQLNFPASVSYQLVPNLISETTRFAALPGNNVILAANPLRQMAFIVNNSTAYLYILEGDGVPSSSNYSGVLAPCTNPDDGSGGVYTVSDYDGIVTAGGSGATCVVVERSVEWALP